MNQPKVLIVEDEFLTGADIRSKLMKMGCRITQVVDSGEAAIDSVHAEKPDLILMDITLSGKMNGIEAAEKIRSMYDIPIIYLTAHTDQSTVSKAKETSPFGYLIKPFDERTLQITVDVTLHRHEMERKLKISEERYRSVAELSDDYIIILDRSHTILFINTAAARFIGDAQESINGKKFSDIAPVDLSNKILPTIDNVFFAGQKYRIQDEYILSGDHSVWLDTSLIPIISGDTDDQVLIVSRDITVEKIIEKDITDHGLAQIEKNMEQFQILNDQIRNPLQTITLMVSLEEGPYTEEILKHIGIIDDLVKQLDRGWLESSKVRSFLMKHYRHGEFANKDKR